MEDGKVSSARGKPGKPESEAAVYVAKPVTGKTNREIGSFLGIKGSAVSEIVRRVERRLGQEEHFPWEMVTLKGNRVK